MGLLRLLLALSVILTHCGELFGFGFVGGRIAVETFFMISGFYIALILNEKYIKKNNSYSLFITNRFLRLYPIYLVTLLVTLTCASCIPNYNANSYMANLTSWIGYGKRLNFTSCSFLAFTNVFIFLQDFVYFLGLNLKSGRFFFTSNFLATKAPQVYTFILIPQSWSISLELLFYLIAPLIVRKKVLFIVILLIASLALKSFYITHGLNSDAWNGRFFPFELMFFLLGTLSYFIYKKIPFVKIPKYAFPVLLILVAIFTIFFSFISVTFYSYRIYIGTIFVSIPFLFHYTKNFKFDRFAGELSYPIYITHMLIFNIAKSLGITNNLPIITIIGSVVFSIILVKLISNPMERLRQGRVKVQTGIDNAAGALSVKFGPINLTKM